MRDPATVTESGDGAGLEEPIFPLIAEDHVFSHGDSTPTVSGKFNRPAFLKHRPLSAETLRPVSSGGFRAHPALSILYPGHYAFRNLASVAQAPLGRMTALRCFHHDTRGPY